MKRYIDADLLKNEICKNKLMSRELITQQILHIIDTQPTADAAEVRHGKWMGEALECSECGKLISCIYDADGYLADGIEKDFKYCPYCFTKSC